MSSSPSTVSARPEPSLLTTQPSPEQTSKTEAQTHLRSVFVSTFVTIFLAELGDKTQVTTLLMSAEAQNPWVVFAGAALALISTSLIGVLVGQWLAQRVSSKTLDTLAAIILLLITIELVAEVVQG